MAKHFMEFAFNDSVRKVQEKYGTRAPYQKMESKGEFRNKLTWQEKGYIKKTGTVFICLRSVKTAGPICSFVADLKDF